MFVNPKFPYNKAHGVVPFWAKDYVHTSPIRAFLQWRYANRHNPHFEFTPEFDLAPNAWYLAIAMFFPWIAP